MQLIDWIEFSKDWNNGLTAKELAAKYGAEVATIRNWVNVLRTKGVNLEKRVKSHLEIDVDEINRNL